MGIPSSVAGRWGAVAFDFMSQVSRDCAVEFKRNNSFSVIFSDNAPCVIVFTQSRRSNQV